MYSFTRPSKGVYLENNKFIFDGIDLSNHVVIEKIKRTLTPSKDVRTSTIPGADGVYIHSSTFGVRKIIVDIRIVEDTYEEALTTQLYIAKILSQRKPKELHLKDFHVLNLHNLAVLTSDTDLGYLLDTLGGQLEFTCYSPFNFANGIKTYNITSSFSNIVNNGWLLSPQIKLQINSNIAGNVTVSTDDGQSIIFKGPFTATSTLIYENFTCRLNGNLMNHLIDFVNSSFITLNPGTTQMKCTGQGSNVCLVIFREGTL